MVKMLLPANIGDIRDMGLIPGSRRSPEGGHGNPLQDSCLENPMDRGAWQASVHSVEKSWTQLKWLTSSSSWFTMLYYFQVYRQVNKFCIYIYPFILRFFLHIIWASQVLLVVKKLPANAGNVGLIPGFGRSPGGKHGNPLQDSCLENPMDRGAW